MFSVKSLFQRAITLFQICLLADFAGISNFLIEIGRLNLFLDKNDMESWDCFLVTIDYIIKLLFHGGDVRLEDINPPGCLGRYFLSIKKKSKLWRLFRSSGYATDFDNFKRQKVSVNRLIYSAKFAFERDIALNFKENPQTFLSYVRPKQKNQRIV